MAFVCPDILPGTIRGGWSNTYIKHSLEDTRTIHVLSIQPLTTHVMNTVINFSVRVVNTQYVYMC